MEKNTRRFKISSRLKPFIELVMKRDNIPYRILQENNEFFVETQLSGNQFHIVVEDALCEKERGNIFDIPVYSYRTLMNPSKFLRLRILNQQNGFKILSRDIKKYNQATGCQYLNY